MKKIGIIICNRCHTCGERRGDHPLRHLHAVWRLNLTPQFACITMAD